MYGVAYLCCELKGRDLESRLLIASHLLGKGYSAVVGQVWALVANAKAHRNLPGCYLFCTSNQAQAKAMSWVADGNHVVVGSDEEALPLVDPLINVSENALQICNTFLVDSDEHMTMLAGAFPQYTAKFAVTGSPRLEAIKTADIELIGGPPYVLFNTGFGIVNSLWGDASAALKALRSGADITVEEARIRLEVERSGLGAFKALIRATAPLYRVVIRPHPSERAQMWRDEFPEVEVVEGSASLPWIKSAKLVVHANSTTGLEAALLNIPALNYDPIPAWGERFVLKRFNHTVHTPQDAADVISVQITPNAPRRQGPLAHTPLPADGAAKTAQALITLMTDGQVLPDAFPWSPMDRAESHKIKFSAHLGEVSDFLERRGTRCAVRELDDSVFLLSPQSP